MKTIIFLLKKYWKCHIKQLFTIAVSIAVVTVSVMCSTLMARTEFRNAFHKLLDECGAMDDSFYNLDDSTISQLEGESVIQDVGVTNVLGRLGNENYSYAYGYYQDSTAQSLMHYSLEKGTFPTKQGEIAIEQSVLSSLGIAEVLNSKVTLKSYDMDNNYLQEETYTLVGVISPLNGYDSERRNNEIGYIDVENNYLQTGYPDPVIIVSKYEDRDVLYKNVNVTYTTGDMYITQFDEVSPALKSTLNEHNAYNSGRQSALLYAIAKNTEEELQSGKQLENTNSTNVSNVYGIVCLIVATVSLFAIVFSYVPQREKSIMQLKLCGMSRKNVICMLCLEVLMFFVLGTAIGLLVGAVFYELVLQFEHAVFNVPIYRGYYVESIVSRQTGNPIAYSITITLLVCVLGFFKPVCTISSTGLSKEVRGRHRVHILKGNPINRAINVKGQSVLQLISLCVTMVVLSVSLTFIQAQIDYIELDYSYLFYDDEGNDISQTLMNQINVYRFKGNDSNRTASTNQATGLSQSSIDALSTDKNVSSIMATLTDGTVKFYLEDTPQNSATIQAYEGNDVKSLLKDSVSDDETINFDEYWNSVYGQYYDDYGISTSDKLYLSSMVACNGAVFNQLEGYLVDGSIDIDAINSGEEVLIFDYGDYSLPSNAFAVGDTINLIDNYFTDDNLTLVRDTIQSDVYIPIETVHQTVRVGGIISIPSDDTSLTKLLKVSNYLGFSFVTTKTGYSNLGFPQYNYDNIIIQMVDYNAIPKFETDVLAKHITSESGITVSSLYDTYSTISAEKGKVVVKYLFMVVLLILIFIVGYVNTVVFQLKINSRYFAILQSLGMNIRRLKLTVIKENLKTPLVALVLSLGICYGIELSYSKFYDSIFNVLENPQTEEQYTQAQDTFYNCFMYLELQNYSIHTYLLGLFVLVLLIVLVSSIVVVRPQRLSIARNIVTDNF